MNVLFSIGFVSTKVKKETSISIMSTDSAFQGMADQFDKQELGMDIMAAIRKQISKLAEVKEQPKIEKPTIFLPGGKML